MPDERFRHFAPLQPSELSSGPKIGRYVRETTLGWESGSGAHFDGARPRELQIFGSLRFRCAFANRELKPIADLRNVKVRRI